MRAGKVIGRSFGRRLCPAAGLMMCGLLLSLTPVAGAVTFSNPAPITIPSQGSASPYPSSIPVSGLSGTTTGATVVLNGFGHTLPSDVAIVLVPPGGTTVLLMSNSGTGPGTSGATITFDGTAGAYLPAVGALATGTYKPTGNSSNAGFPSFAAPGPGGSFCNPGPATGGAPCAIPTGGDALAGALNGFDPNGTWNLYVVDRFSGDAGQIAGGWTLNIAAGGGAQRTLNVAKAGPGAGAVTSVPAGISCGADCAQAYADGTSVTLTATPASNSNLASWSGCDSVTTTTCTVAINAARNVTATFDLNPPQALTVTKNGTAAGLGSVTSSPPGIACGATCTTTYPGGTAVVLTANAPVGSVFGGFTGCDSMTTTTCIVSLATARNVDAMFTAVPTRTLRVATGGTGTGAVAGPGIACGVDCTEPYNDATSVVLVASPVVAGSRFVGWRACDNPIGTTCTMSMTADKTVTATFTQGPSTISAPLGIALAPPDTVAPTLTGVRVTRHTFAVAGEATPTTGFAAARRHERGTTVSYALSETATAKIAIAQRRSGRRKGQSCVAPARKLRRAAKCTRVSPRGTLTRISAQGANAVFFSGRLRSKALIPGRYQATLTAIDGARNVSKPSTIFFEIVPR